MEIYPRKPGFYFCANHNLKECKIGIIDDLTKIKNHFCVFFVESDHSLILLTFIVENIKKEGTFYYQTSDEYNAIKTKILNLSVDFIRAIRYSSKYFDEIMEIFEEIQAKCKIENRNPTTKEASKITKLMNLVLAIS